MYIFHLYLHIESAVAPEQYMLAKRDGYMVETDS